MFHLCSTEVCLSEFLSREGEGRRSVVQREFHLVCVIRSPLFDQGFLDGFLGSFDGLFDLQGEVLLVSVELVEVALGGLLLGLLLFDFVEFVLGD